VEEVITEEKSISPAESWRKPRGRSNGEAEGPQGYEFKGIRKVIADDAMSISSGMTCNSSMRSAVDEFLVWRKMPPHLASGGWRLVSVADGEGKVSSTLRRGVPEVSRL
jgi:hypothetical protein